jgi:hypothetical protein
MALIFVGFTMLILILLLLAAIHYVPKALAEEDHGGEEPDQPGPGPAH